MLILVCAVNGDMYADECLCAHVHLAYSTLQCRPDVRLTETLSMLCCVSYWHLVHSIASIRGTAQTLGMTAY